MHDPMTVAFEIKRPWRQRPSEMWPKGYRPTWVTIWHVDPERDGSDDSCGWSYPKVASESEWVKRLAHDIEFLNRKDSSALSVQRCREGSVGWRLLWLQRASFWHRGKPLRAKQLVDALFSESFPGNRDESWDPTQEKPERLAWVFARVYLQLTRPWYRHPRWHLWHWKIQVHAVQNFKRWAWSRCCRCGKRFRFGESPVSSSWHSRGPGWFRGETDIYHGDCSRPGQGMQAQSAVAAQD